MFKRLMTSLVAMMAACGSAYEEALRLDPGSRRALHLRYQLIQRLARRRVE